MTAYELLWMYARLRGIPEGKIGEAVDIEIRRLDLQAHAKNLCGTYRYVCTCNTLMYKSVILLGFLGLSTQLKCNAYDVLYVYRPNLLSAN